jgi:hypothetical protein
MKDQYFGDINDYRKYGLLRALAAGGEFPIAVCWMLTPSDGSSDGRFVEYLSDPGDFWDLDPPLYDFLQDAVLREGDRRVAVLEGTDLIPGARYWSALTPDGALARRRFFDEFTAFASGASLVFFDPDNGMEVPSVPFGLRNSNKYLYWSEAQRTYDRGHSLLVYQHFPRVERRNYTRSRAASFADRCPGSGVTSLSTSRVVFFLVAQPEHGAALTSALARIEERWSSQVSVQTHAFPG